MKPKVIAIVPAGGSGRRMQSRSPKQYLLLNGKPVLVHTLLKLQQSPFIDDILLVVPESDIFFVQENMEGPYQLTKIRDVIAGGKERQDSVKNGLTRAGDEYDVVVIHDGVRPLVTDEIIFGVIRESMRCGAAIAGVPARDTVKEVSPDGSISRTLDRDRIWMAQTPQAFQRGIIQEAYQKAAADDFLGTDDASLVERLGIPVKMIFGSYTNIKITTPDDLILAEAFLKQAESDACCPPIFQYPERDKS